MKKLLLLNALFWIGFVFVPAYSMEQDFGSEKEEEKEYTAQEKVPTLKQLSLQKIDVRWNDIENFLQKVPYDLHDEVSEKAFMESDSFAPIKEVITKLDSDAWSKIANHLVSVIPSLFFKLFMNSQVSLGYLIKWINSLPAAKKDMITMSFSNKIKQFMTQEKIVDIELMSKEKWISFPVDFERIALKDGELVLDPLVMDAPTQKSVSRKFITVPVPEVLIPFFIGQQIQQLIIQPFKDENKIRSLFTASGSSSEIFLIDSNLMKNIKRMLNEVERFIEAHKKTYRKKAYPEKTYSDLKEYFARLQTVVWSLSNAKIITYRDYTWDENLGFHVRDEEQPLRRIP